ncbi:cyclin-T2-like isoform X2 [Stegodyphus dumicola]|uniref:cyclin-T2-like isoform X2 n=1 Tax=Stegodyphus dumicola TaxID=202533 RepID=UPI0015B35205|nr:cyclin-T2-like isoform X2 [Stegodyphus dumicola]
MENVNRFYFTKDQLANSPSRKCGIDQAKELSYRQQAANFIQDMGQRLHVSQLCINTAIVYMHRFYLYHSFTDVHRNSLSIAALFLGAKIEEQPRKLEHVIKVAHVCLHKDAPPLDVKSEAYLEKQYEVVALENILLQTLASRELAQTSYFMATTSLHMTTMCLQYEPPLVACVCIHLACKWSSWKIEPCSEGKEWYYYVDKTVTLERLETLTQEFIAILETSPHRFKRKFIQQKDAHGSKGILDESSNPGKHSSFSSESKIDFSRKDSSPGPSSISFNLCSDTDEKPAVKVEGTEKSTTPLMQPAPLKKEKIKVEPSHSISIEAYREKREKERLEHKSSVVPPDLSSVHQTGNSKSQHAFNENERIHHKSVVKPSELPSHSKEKGSKSSTVKDILTNPTSQNKLNHQLPKMNSDASYAKDNKHSLDSVSRSSAHVSNDPVVILERCDAKSEIKDVADSDVRDSAMHSSNDKLTVMDHTDDDVQESAYEQEAALSVKRVIESAHKKKHKANSLHNSQNAFQPISQGTPLKQSPAKDIKTNGSKETDVDARVHTPLVNDVGSKSAEILPSKHERREKHRSKHSAHSSKDKSISNHSEQSTPGIKVKIRKDIICLPEKPPAVDKSESPKKAIKLKIRPHSQPTPEPPKIKTANPPPTTTPIKLVITKDKSGSGSYSTSHKNERESRKRVHSPANQDSNSKNFYESSSKYAKVDHSHKSHNADGSIAVPKQGKISRHGIHRSNMNTQQASNDLSSGRLQHQVNDATVYNNVDVGNYGEQPFYPHYYPYQVTPPPPPPVLRGHGLPVGKTNSNPPLPPPLPPQPPPPPPE